MQKGQLALLFLVLLSLFSPKDTRAQTSINLYNGGNQEVGLAIIKPSFENDSNLAFFSSVWYLYGRFPVGVNVAILADLPISFVSESGGDESEFMPGNPFLGVEFQRPVSPIYGHFGVKIPLAADDNFSAALFGILADYDNLSAFTTDALPVVLRIGRREITPEGFYSNVLIGGELIFFTEGGFGDDTDPELLLTYQALVGYDSGKARFAAGFTGLALATESDGSFAENSIHQIILQVNSVFDQIRPGIVIRLPVDEDFEDLIDFVVSLTLSVDLNG